METKSKAEMLAEMQIQEMTARAAAVADGQLDEPEKEPEMKLILPEAKKEIKTGTLAKDVQSSETAIRLREEKLQALFKANETVLKGVENYGTSNAVTN